MNRSPHEFTGQKKWRKGVKVRTGNIIELMKPMKTPVVCLCCTPNWRKCRCPIAKQSMVPEMHSRIEQLEDQQSDILSMVRKMPCLCTALNPLYKGNDCPRCKILNKYDTEFIDSPIES